jgi:uncharacterized protein (TIGR03790 family)
MGGKGSFYIAACVFLSRLFAAEPGSEVVLVYNSASAASKSVAEHYAAAREVPREQIVALPLPETETMTRNQFEQQLRAPLWRELLARNLFITNAPGASDRSTVARAKVRYAVLCYGVPVKILADPTLKEEGAEKLQLELRRNEASVDSELAVLPMHLPSRLLAGPLNNPVQAVTNREALHPTNGVLMVARLDGPTPEIARGLVDKALLAERDGLWGRAYFDWRGLNEGAYKVGDEWIKNARDLAKAYGFETVSDPYPSTFPATAPLSDIAFYFGWYDQGPSGPFTNGMTTFRPGAIAYHLHSFSARALRVNDAWWAGPLLDRGATATMGCTEEPFLQTTPQLHIFMHRLLFQGFTFGEAAYASQNTLSWQNTIVGDPLYRPFAKTQQERYEELEARKHPAIEWSMLMWINVRLAQGATLSEILKFYDANPVTKTSAVLQEKLGEIYKSRGKLIDAMDPFLAALQLEMPPLQRLRVSLAVGSLLSSFGKASQAFDLYEEVLRNFPDYAEKRDLHERLAKLATRLGKHEEAAEYERLFGGVIE